MTISQRIFYLLEQNHMTQKEFSKRTGIATTTISDWRKKNTNPGSDKIMAICAALEVSPEYLLSGVTEDSSRGKNIDYMVLPKDAEERILVELYSDMSFINRTHLFEYAKKLSENNNKEIVFDKSSHMEKISEFNDIEIYMDSTFQGSPSIGINYLDDDVYGTLSLESGIIEGSFSKYVLPVINEWFYEHKSLLLNMWASKELSEIPAWE